MNIFLDDRRPCPKGYCGFSDYEKCVFFLSKVKEIDIISLDYDLGETCTGFDVLVYMNKKNIIPKKINIHSSHAFGIIRMESFAKLNFKSSIVTTGSPL